MNQQTYATMVVQLDEILDDGRSMTIEQDGDGGYELTVHYWHPTECRQTHFHTGGVTLPEAIERARHTLAEVLPTGSDEIKGGP